MFTNVQEAEKISAYRTIKETLFKAEKLDFEDLALQVFQLQAVHNPIYRHWLDLLKLSPEAVLKLEDIPYLPIEFFKSKRLSLFKEEPPYFFQSSGTGGYGQSKHVVYQEDLYDHLTDQGFEQFYGPVADYTVLALLPAYLEREGSSLVRMADRFIEASSDRDSGFFLHDLATLHDTLARKKKEGRKVLLLGVSFALWDLAEQYPIQIPNAVIMETGGMKGRRKEILRSDLHQILQKAFGTASIHSEYGMTELFSQAYSQGQGIFRPTATMRVQIREMEDPFALAKPGKTGGINIIDLGNLDSCAFIETQDLGKLYHDGTFKVLGRFDRAEVRGCNLMLQ